MARGPQWIASRGLAAALCVGCGSEARPAGAMTSSVALPAPPSATAGATRPIDPDTWCKEIRRQSQEALDAAADRAQREATDRETRPERAPAWCVRAGETTWALWIHHAEYGPSAREAWGVIVDGVRVVVLAGSEARFDHDPEWGTPSLSDIDALEAIDFDGDGVAELTWLYRPEHPEGVTVSQRRFMRLKDGVVAPYAFPGAAWIDADGDGRLDALSDAVTFDHTACWNETAFERVPLLQHQLADGTFSGDDAVARAHAREACGERPRVLFVKSKAGIVDEGKSLARLECARLWGATMDEVDRALAAACPRAPKDPAYCEGTPVKDTCNFGPAMRQIAEETPPILAR